MLPWPSGLSYWVWSPVWSQRSGVRFLSGLLQFLLHFDVLITLLLFISLLTGVEFRGELQESIWILLGGVCESLWILLNSVCVKLLAFYENLTGLSWISFARVFARVDSRTLAEIPALITFQIFLYPINCKTPEIH